MKQQLIRGVIEVVRVPLVALKWFIELIYPFLFGQLDQRISRRLHEAFEEEVRDSMHFLFSDFGAKIVRGKEPRVPTGFDHVEVVVAFGSTRLKFERSRGTYTAVGAHERSPTAWVDLERVIMLCAGAGSGAQMPFRDLWALASLIEPQMSCVIRYFECGWLGEMEES